MLEGVAGHPDAHVTSGSATLSRATLTLANSHGLERTMERTECGCSLEAICGQSTGSEFDQSPFLDIDPRRVGDQAGFLAVHSAGGREIADGQYSVILSPVAFAQLLGYIVVPALSGRNVHAGRSRLASLLSTRCMDPALDLRDDPFARGMGATAWDAEGVPARRLDFVREGTLRAFAYDLKTAYRYGEETTASAVRGGFGGAPSIGIHNLVLDGKRSDITRERALYVHDVVGAHTANPMSGDFSVECQNPVWMEDGALREPVRKAMIAGNLFDALAELGGIGKDSRIVGNAILPSVRLKQVQVIGA
jgi:PmbA protein